MPAHRLHTLLRKLLHGAVAALLSLQLALPELLPGDSDRWRGAGCAHDVACAPLHGLNDGAVTAAATAPARLPFGSTVQAPRGAAGAEIKAGIDLLFCARAELQLARATTALEQHAAVKRRLQLAAQSFSAAAPRAPPLS